MTGRWEAMRAEFAPRRLPATVVTGLTLALVNALLTVAIISLIFSGDLAAALPTGIGLGLVASGVLGLVLALRSGFGGMYSGIQDSSAAVLGLAAASIATTVVGPKAVDTVVAMMIATSLATGAVFLAMARFRLGEIARFVPFPVIGGLLAGTGYLIVDGSIDILRAGASWGDVITTDALGLLWPGLAFAALFVLASRRSWPSRVMLGLMLGGVAGFHVVSRLAGSDKTESLARGWLLGPFPDEGLWPGFAADAIGGADWGAIVGEAASLITILLLVPLTLLLYISALEVETKTDLDLNSELRAAGWANMAAGAVGGPPGFFYLSDTVVTYKLVGQNRGGPIVASVAILGIVLIGGSVLELLPQFVIGGLLLFVGIDFMVEWLWISRRRMSRLDYALMVGIVVVIATVGFLPGVAVGLGAAVALFVLRYSRVQVVKHQLSIKTHRSNIERPIAQAEHLVEVGDAALILELHGFIFFGTVNQIVERVKARFEGALPLRYVVFDFRLATGVDSSAVALFGRMAQLARDAGTSLVLAGLTPRARQQFVEFFDDYGDVVREEVDLDRAVQWCEDQLLADLDTGAGDGRALPDGLATQLDAYLDPLTMQAGDVLMRQGDPTPGIYLIVSGRATVSLEDGSGAAVRLRTLLEGTVLGEIGLYRNEPCTATVTADTECHVLLLRPQAFDELRRENPAAAADLHFFVAHSLAGRLGHANTAVRALRG